MKTEVQTLNKNNELFSVYSEPRSQEVQLNKISISLLPWACKLLFLCYGCAGEQQGFPSGVRTAAAPLPAPLRALCWGPHEWGHGCAATGPSLLHAGATTEVPAMQSSPFCLPCTVPQDSMQGRDVPRPARRNKSGDKSALAHRQTKPSGRAAPHLSGRTSHSSPIPGARCLQREGGLGPAGKRLPVLSRGAQQARAPAHRVVAVLLLWALSGLCCAFAYCLFLHRTPIGRQALNLHYFYKGDKQLPPAPLLTVDIWVCTQHAKLTWCWPTAVGPGPKQQRNRGSREHSLG